MTEYGLTPVVGLASRKGEPGVAVPAAGVSSRAWEQRLESPEQAPVLLGSGLTHWCLCVLSAMDHMQSIISMIPYLVLVSLLALAFSVRLYATGELCQTCP